MKLGFHNYIYSQSQAVILEVLSVGKESVGQVLVGEKLFSAPAKLSTHSLSHTSTCILSRCKAV